MPHPPPIQSFRILERLPRAGCYHVAYSGGRDSHVLLHVLASSQGQLPGELRAIHVNHGLHPHAARWARHCQTVCGALSVPLTVVEVDASAGDGESPEAAARRARYQAFARLVGEGDCLLTAHHRDDQAETLLLQLLRGSGPHGLAGMPARALFGKGLHARPLLDCTRAQLDAYAAARKLEWIEDPSNRDTGLRRNFIRHQVMPVLAAQWPAVAGTLSRSAAHCAEAAQLLDDLAAGDLRRVEGRQPGQLELAALLNLDEARQRNVMRYWIRSQGFPLPRQAHLERIQRDVLHAAPGRSPRVCWTGAEIRRYRNTLYVMQPLSSFDNTVILPWNMERPLPLPGDLGRLAAVMEEGGGLAQEIRQRDDITVRFRQGGEACRPAGRGHALSLKKLFQERGIPPWQRERIPLLYAGGQLAAVVGVCACEPFTAGRAEPGLALRVQPCPRG